MKRFSITDLPLRVAVDAMTAYLAREQIQLAQRRFTAGAIAMGIVSTAALDVSACGIDIAFIVPRAAHGAERHPAPSAWLTELSGCGCNHRAGPIL